MNRRQDVPPMRPFDRNLDELPERYVLSGGYDVYSWPTRHVVVGRTLAEVRERLPKGLVRMARRLFDVDHLIETWV